MKVTRISKSLALVVIALLPASASHVRAQVTISPPNFTVTTPSGQYKFFVNGVSSAQPAQDAHVDDSLNFTVNAGATYIFNMNTTAGLHPVDICTSPVTSAHYSGASAQAVTTGTVTLTIPATNYPNTLYYICNNHTFYGIITVAPPQTSPAVTILNAAIAKNIVLTFSGGTNVIQLVPQFSSNLAANVWSPVPGYTNTFSGSVTNTTSFNRLDAICGPAVYLRISQAH